MWYYVNMHQIQSNILSKLSEAKSARYSDLKQTNMEGNVFTYHLKKLVREGYVLQRNQIYLLSPKGKLFADRVSHTDFKERIQPKIITAIIIKNKNKYLLYKRKKQPFFDHVGFPYGKIHLDERIHDAAQRELKEKAALDATLKYRGHIYVTVHDETELVSSMLCHVFTGKLNSGVIKTDLTDTKCFWGKLEDFPRSKLLPGVIQMERLVKENLSKIFFEEYFLNTTEDLA